MLPTYYNVHVAYEVRPASINVTIQAGLWKGPCRVDYMAKVQRVPII